ncbi:MAG: iron-containing alcohol dehydrogenase [Paludibacteraceae bacterium]|nr:iron-containing alcohol dehydrogenase [Paludibacteraceae bacterium]MBQ7748741.1 iron-containing alcohol dehydrogenase [Paludibacteraceae bacterium]
MNNFVYYSPTEFVFGRDTESQAGELAKKYGAKKVMIFFGKGSVVRSGLLKRVEDSLSKAGLEFFEFGGIQANPLIDKAREGVEVAKKENPDMLMAVGGGSVIDTAKAVAAGYYYDGDVWDFYLGKCKPEKALKVSVVLTIPAAGSEGSGNSVITNMQTNKKLGLRMPLLLRPVFSIMNPELTYTLPPYQTACGISDMMAHIMERYFTNTKDVFVTDEFCEGLLRAIIKEAPKVFANPEDYEARANIMWAGTMAHNDVCGVGREEDWTSHGIEHELSAIDDTIAHGAGLAVVFPAFLDAALQKNPSKVAQFAVKVFGVQPKANEIETAKEGVAKLRAFFKSIGMPVTLTELGAEHVSIDDAVEHLRANRGDSIGFYVQLTMEEVKDLLRAVK